jgi:hypothetical protein
MQDLVFDGVFELGESSRFPSSALVQLSLLSTPSDVFSRVYVVFGTLKLETNKASFKDAGYYGLSMVVGSYTVFFVSLLAHLSQFAFLVLFENPRMSTATSRLS